MSSSSHAAELSCPACGAALVVGARFCGACGHPLAAPLSAASSAAACAQHPDVAALGACTRCGAFACGACLREGPDKQPVCLVCLERMPPGEVPWEGRAELGFWTAWWKTTAGGMISPGKTFSAMPRDPQLGSAAAYAAFQSLIAAVPTSLLYMGLIGVMAFVDETNTSSTGERLAPALIFVAWAILAPLVGVATTFVWGSVDHGVLRLFGGKGTWAVTVRATAYAQAPLALGVIPICSVYVWPIWSLVTRFYAYRAAHQASTGVALAGALATPLLCCGLWGGTYAVILFTAMSKVAAGSP